MEPGHGPGPLHYASTFWFLGFALIANGDADKEIPVLEKATAFGERNQVVIGMLVRA